MFPNAYMDIRRLTIRSCMISIAAFVGVLILLSVSHAQSSIPPEFLGTWILSAESAQKYKFPQKCQNLRMEFTSDEELITFSGELRIVVKVAIKRQSNGFLMRQDIIEHNGKPNCQGKSLDYIASRFVHEIYYELFGKRLREYIWTKESGRFVEYIRP